MDFCENENNRVTPNGRRVGKKDLCVTLGWSRTRLDRRIATDPDFPVLQCDTQGGGWLFDLDAVLAHLAMVPSVRRLGRPAASTLHDQARGRPSVNTQVAHMRALGQVIDKSIRELCVAMDRLEELTCGTSSSS